jgi:ABC-2 type transport system ATP-binding protein
MMKRLEIAQALVNRPKILFLDEPSIGLDPSVREVWKQVKKLNKEFGMTVFMTTHDMTEADELCDRLVIMNAGRIVVSGTPSELKKAVGGDVISVRFCFDQNGFNDLSARQPILLPREMGA